MEPEGHYRVHKSPSVVPILSQIDPVLTIPPYLSEIYFHIADPPTSWSSIGGYHVTTAWRVLRLRMEQTASRYGG
jgi:hypothetical protein